MSGKNAVQSIYGYLLDRSKEMFLKHCKNIKTNTTKY